MKSLLVAALVALAGCSVPDVTAAIDQGDAPAPTTKKTTSGKQATGTTGDAITPVDTTSDPTTVDDTATSATTPAETTTPATTPTTKKPATFTGTIESTNPVMFGGGSVCRYQVVLTNLQVSLTLDGDGHPTASSVSGTMTETVVQDGCNAGTPYGSLPYAFSFSGAAGAIDIMETGDPDNRPGGTLHLTGTQSGSTVHANLVFHRTDIGAPLDWTVTTSVDLQSGS